jgi:hypothetical protein
MMHADTLHADDPKSKVPSAWDFLAAAVYEKHLIPALLDDDENPKYVNPDSISVLEQIIQDKTKGAYTPEPGFDPKEGVVSDAEDDDENDDEENASDEEGTDADSEAEEEDGEDGDADADADADADTDV